MKQCIHSKWRKAGLALLASSVAFSLLATPATYNGLASVTDPSDPTNGGFWDLSGSAGIAVDAGTAVSTSPFVSLCQVAAPILTTLGFFETSHRYRDESAAIGINTRPVRGLLIFIR